MESLLTKSISKINRFKPLFERYLLRKNVGSIDFYTSSKEEKGKRLYYCCNRKNSID